jgi:hypothetical protein
LPKKNKLLFGVKIAAKKKGFWKVFVPFKTLGLFHIFWKSCTYYKCLAKRYFKTLGVCPSKIWEGRFFKMPCKMTKFCFFESQKSTSGRDLFQMKTISSFETI